MSDAIALRNRFAMVKGAWDDHLRGTPFPPLGERFDRLEEQLAIITGMWTTPVGERRTRRNTSPSGASPT